MSVIKTYTKVRIDVKGTGRYVGEGSFDGHLRQWRKANPDKELLSIDYDTKEYVFEDSEHYGYQCDFCDTVTKFEDEILKHEKKCDIIKKEKK